MEGGEQAVERATPGAAAVTKGNCEEGRRAWAAGWVAECEELGGFWKSAEDVVDVFKEGPWGSECEPQVLGCWFQAE